MLYELDWSFLAVVTDFGVPTSLKLMGQRGTPEVVKGITSLHASPTFGQDAPEKHISRNANRPHFSRDLYTVLKWLRFQSSNLPPLPQPIQQQRGVQYHLAFCRKESNNGIQLRSTNTEFSMRDWVCNKKYCPLR